MMTVCFLGSPKRTALAITAGALAAFLGPRLAAAETFGSLMTDRVEARAAAGMEKPVIIVFQRAGMPVQVLDGAGGWLRIQDYEGTSGWVRSDLVSKRRTALAIKPEGGNPITVRVSEREQSSAVAILEPGVIVGIVSCDAQVCKISASGVRGYIDQNQLWGVAAGEVIR